MRMEQTTHNIESKDKGAAWLSGAGLAVAFAALVGASCCVLPILLASGGVGGAWIAQLGVFVGKVSLFEGAANDRCDLVEFERFSEIVVSTASNR